MFLANLSWPAVQNLSPEIPIVVPIAAIEQHGPHLPLCTDSLLLGEVVRRAEEQTAERAVFLPVLWLGNSHHHLDFCGTLSASPRVYLDVLVDLTESLLRHGFKRIVLLNGHGGNAVPSRQALYEVRQRHRAQRDLLLLSVSYWECGTPDCEQFDMIQRQVAHACEWETSMMLVAAPHLVGDLAQVSDLPRCDGFSPALRAWTTKDLSTMGHIGMPGAATAGKGEALLNCFGSGVARMLGRIADWDGRSGSNAPEPAAYRTEAACNAP